MKIVLLITLIIILIIILIIFYFQYKPIEKFTDIDCISNTANLAKLKTMKEKMQSIITIIDNINTIATSLNNNSPQKIALDKIPSSNKADYDSAVNTYNKSSIKKLLDLIIEDKDMLDDYYQIVFDNYDNQNKLCNPS